MKQSRSWILVITAALIGLGLVMVFSTSAVHAERFGSATKLLVRQAVWLANGLAVMLAAWRVDYHFYERHWKIITVITCLALALVLIPGLGTRFNGARRWFRLLGYGIQPSEFAKIAVVIFVAAWLSTCQPKMLDNLFKGFLPVAGGVAAMFLLVALEPDAGTALLLAAVAFAMFIIGGVRMKHLLPIAAVVVPVFIFVVLTHLDYVDARLSAFLHPESDPLGHGYQPMQSVLALGSGGIFGRGLGAGQIKLHFLPEAHTDFVLSIIGEELGLVGTLTVIALFIGLIYHGMKVAMTAPDRFGFLLVFGLVLFLGVQAAINIAVVTASAPTKGISLPLVSYGGSSLLASLFSLGVVLNVARAGEMVESRDGELAEMTADPGEAAPNPLAG